MSIKTSALVFLLGPVLGVPLPPKSAPHEASRSLVVNGRDAGVGEAPYAVSLQLWTTSNTTVSVDSIERHHFCTGALIAPNTVLTAGHCVYTKVGNGTIGPLEHIRVVSGVSDWKDHSSATVSRVKSVAGAGYQHRSDIEDDVALIFLDECLPDSPTIKVATPGTPRDLPCGAYNRATIMGWGAQTSQVSDLWHIEQRTSELQIHTGVPIHHQSTCQKAQLSNMVMSMAVAMAAKNETLGTLEAHMQELTASFDAAAEPIAHSPNPDPTPSQIVSAEHVDEQSSSTFCFGGGDDVGVCFGDSGGPIVVDGVVVGVNSYIMGPCSMQADYGARVSFYADWIARTMKQHAACGELSDTFESWPVAPPKRSQADGNACNSELGELMCPASGQCLTLEQRCNGVVDCPGGLDELENCEPSEFSLSACAPAVEEKLRAAEMVLANWSFASLNSSIQLDLAQRQLPGVAEDFNNNTLRACHRLLYLDGMSTAEADADAPAAEEAATIKAVCGAERFLDQANASALDKLSKSLPLSDFEAIKGMCMQELKRKLIWPARHEIQRDMETTHATACALSSPSTTRVADSVGSGAAAPGAYSLPLATSALALLWHMV